MRKIFIFSIIAALTVVLSGCGTTIQAYNNVQKMKKRNTARLNLQSTPPDVKPLEQYAETPLAKKLYFYIDSMNTDPDAIPSEYMDPATNPEAAEQVEKDIALAKKGLIKTSKNSGANRAMLAQMIKSTEEDLRKPFWKVTDLPEGAEIGIIRNMEGNQTAYFKRKASKYLYFTFPIDKDNPGAVRAKISEALDSFLLKSDKWTKAADLTKQSNQDALETISDTIELQKKQLSKYSDDIRFKDAKDRLKLSIEKNENMKAYFQKQLEKNISPITFYKYSWNKSGKPSVKDMASTLSVTVKSDVDVVNISIMKLEYE